MYIIKALIVSLCNLGGRQYFSSIVEPKKMSTCLQCVINAYNIKIVLLTFCLGLDICIVTWHHPWTITIIWTSYCEEKSSEKRMQKIYMLNNLSSNYFSPRQGKPMKASCLYFSFKGSGVSSEKYLVTS